MHIINKRQSINKCVLILILILIFSTNVYARKSFEVNKLTEDIFTNKTFYNSDSFDRFYFGINNNFLQTLNNSNFDKYEGRWGIENDLLCIDYISKDYGRYCYHAKFADVSDRFLLKLYDSYKNNVSFEWGEYSEGKFIYNNAALEKINDFVQNKTIEDNGSDADITNTLYQNKYNILGYNIDFSNKETFLYKKFKNSRLKTGFWNIKNSILTLQFSKIKKTFLIIIDPFFELKGDQKILILSPDKRLIITQKIIYKNE